MTTTYLAPDPIQSTQLIPGGNTPANGGKLFFYAAGSSTKQTVYKDNAGAVQWSNPIVLDSGGNLTNGGVVWFTSGQTYKVVFAPSTDTDPPVSPYWTKDNLAGINDTSSSQSEWVSGPTPTFVNATSFTLSGDQTSTFHVGRRLRTTNTGGTIYSTITAAAFGALTTITVVNDSGSIDSGISAVSYGLLSGANPSEPAIGDTYVCRGRLTLTSGTPVTTADVTAAETVYFTPFQGNRIDLYDATALRWVRYKFTELTLDVPDATQMNDVFIYNNSGTLTLEAVAWTNDTTRATALTTQDGVLVKTGATGRRFLGSFYGTTAGNGQTEDARGGAGGTARRWLWNYYNRVDRDMFRGDTTDSWTYATDTWRPINNSTSNSVSFVAGVAEDAVVATYVGYVVTAGASAGSIGVGIDSSTSNAAQVFPELQPSLSNVMTAKYTGVPSGVGLHTIYAVERVRAAGTVTYLGDNGLPANSQYGLHVVVKA